MKRIYYCFLIGLFLLGMLGCSNNATPLLPNGNTMATEGNIQKTIIEEKINNTTEEDWVKLFRLIAVVYQPDLGTNWSEEKGFASSEELSSDSLFRFFCYWCSTKESYTDPWPREYSINEIQRVLIEKFSGTVHFDPDDVEVISEYKWFNPETNIVTCKWGYGFMLVDDYSLQIDSILINDDDTVTVTASNLNLILPGQEELNGGTMKITLCAAETGWQYKDAYFYPKEE